MSEAHHRNNGKRKQQDHGIALPTEHRLSYVDVEPRAMGGAPACGQPPRAPGYGAEMARTSIAEGTADRWVALVDRVVRRAARAR